MLEMTSDNPTNARKHVTSNITCAHSQQYAQKIQSSEKTLCVIRLHISHLSSNQMSFQMAQQTGCRYVNYHKRKHADAYKQDHAKDNITTVVSTVLGLLHYLCGLLDDESPVLSLLAQPVF